MSDDWYQQAACRGATHLFYPERGSTADADRARAICATCPVADPCRAAGVFEEHGMWAGQSPNERKLIRRSMPAVCDDCGREFRHAGALGMHRRGMHGPFEHGTPSGAQRHRARGERPCWACAEAWAQDRARRRLEAAS